jgi:hypothetical protein
MPTESAALPYDLNCARFVGHETEKTGRLDTHTTATTIALLPRVNLTYLIPKLNVLVIFPSLQLTFIAS